MEFEVINSTDGTAGSQTVKLDTAIFDRQYNEALVHQVVTAFLANARSGTRAQKTRSEVSHSTKKPFRQKGTGRARAGMTSSPLWRGGGRIFPNRPDENFSHKVNRRMYRLAISSILSQLIRDKNMLVINDISVDAPKTKQFIQVLKTLSLHDSRALVIVEEFDYNLYLAARNLNNVLIVESHQVDPYLLLCHDKVVFTAKAIEQFQLGQAI